VVLLAAAERAGVVAGENALTERVECFTVRLDHSTPARLRCGSEPYFIIHSSTAPYRYVKPSRTDPTSKRVPAHAHAPPHMHTTDVGAGRCAQTIRRVEKILRCWGKDGQEVKVAEASDGKAPVMNLTVGMSALLQVKPKIVCQIATRAHTHTG
jgi:hypothetical protein